MNREYSTEVVIEHEQPPVKSIQRSADTGMPVDAWEKANLLIQRGTLDGELMKIFLKSGDYLNCAEEHPDSSRIDEVDIDAWLEEYYIEPIAPLR